MAYIPSECTLEQYEQQIYSGDSEHRLYIKHGSTVIGDEANDYASPFASNLVWKNKLLNNGSTNFCLSNFVSKEISLTLYNYTIENLEEELEIKIGTYINSVNKWVYIPLGIYIIQDAPTKNGRYTTYTLRDRSVKLDFNYNGKELIDNSQKVDEDGNKYVTKLEVVDDICNKAGLKFVGNRNFLGYDDKLAIYDNKKTGRKHISYIAEQADCIATIDRNGDLIFVVINNNLTQREVIEDYIESFTDDVSYKISKVMYEIPSTDNTQNLTIYENGTDENDILYIDSSNPYIENQEQLDRVANSIIGFEINSFTISKTYGNPTIDCYDFIVLNYENKLYKTLAQYDLTFGGSITSKYSTVIKNSTKQNNTSLNSQATFKKFVNQTFDNVNATLTTQAGIIDDQESRLAEVELSAEGLEITVSQSKQDVNNLKQEVSDNTTAIGTMQGTIKEMSFSFQTDGLKIGKEGEDINSTLDNAGLKIYNMSTLIAIFNKNGSGMKKVIATESIQLQNLLLKKGTKQTQRHGNINVIQGFWQDNLIETLEDLEVDTLGTNR